MVTQINIKNIPDDLLTQLNNMATNYGKSRNALLLDIMAGATEAVEFGEAAVL